MTRLTRSIAIASLLAVIASACASQEATCASIADDAIAVLQDTIDLVADFTEEELTAFVSSGSGTPAALADLERRGDELSDVAASIGCSDGEMAGLLVDRSGDLDATNDFGRFVVETLRTGAFFSDE